MSNFTLPTEINALVDAVRKFISDLEKSNSQVSETAKKSLDGYLDKLKQIQTHLNVQGYKLVFIGEPGIGKTTAICNYLNLLKSNKTNEQTLNNMTLLNTATGRTTVAEVHLKQTTGTSCIHIQYMPLSEQLAYINNYCEYYWDVVIGVEKRLPNHTSTSKPSHAICSEYERIVRNMTGLETPASKESTQENERIKWKKQYDGLSKFNNNYDGFYQSIIKSINIEKRQRTYFKFKGEQSFEKWLKDLFTAINNGKHEETSIPQTITIELNRSDIDLYYPQTLAITEIIDTKGLEGGNNSEVKGYARPDLKALLRSEDTICILMDQLTTLPSNSLSCILKEAFPKVSCEYYKYSVLKASIMVKSPASELKAVNESGNDENRGKEIKRDELYRRIDADEIPYNKSNTLFIDCCAPYNKNLITKTVKDPVTNQRIQKETVHFDYEDEFAQEIRDEIDEKLKNLIDNQKEILTRNAEEIRDNIIKLCREIRNTNQNKIAEAELNQMRQKILAKKNSWFCLNELTTYLSNQKKNIGNELIDKLYHISHTSTLNAVNTRYGEFYPKFNLYNEIEESAENIYNNHIEYIKNQIEIITNSENPIVKNKVNGLYNKINIYTIDSSRNFSKAIRNWAELTKFAPRDKTNEFWNSVKDEWGKGSGYTNRVHGHYQNHMRNSDPELRDRLDRVIADWIDYVAELFKD